MGLSFIITLYHIDVKRRYNVRVMPGYIKTYKCRLYPTRAQVSALDTTLETLRDVYNSLLNDRKYLYETTGKGPSQYDQQGYFKSWRAEHAELKQIHSHLLQNAAL